ncbi:glycoside hydrolase family 32 protein [Burkholderia oklahomensis]|uniref:glycoside hydrolase family 32 protein n=1 Tax=Burkholderia oklahomensis TaxID=342113 RepID=UPI002652A689|nr:glycoside hydrolase family 32 protein [Burkholderia oklahomensis]MDN7674705.1 glycoside hydrolase family 32 protein [Burkholderia oklahomensis]
MFISRIRVPLVLAGATAAVLCAAAHASSAPCPSPSPTLADGTPQWRPALHYAPQRNWMNDPNGLVYDGGVYHLFYQYNPHGNFWGDMSWGHATSRDLVHWDEQPVAMPANAREEIFSGSIVADARNTSGLGTASAPPLVALYTSVYKAGSGHAPGTQAQSLAYSIDHGRTWRPYAHNPVLTLEPESQHFRDPKVSWYAPGGYWLMSTVVADAHVVKLYRSSDLIHWDFLSDFTLPDVPHRGALWEMPELLPMPLDGDARRTKWVMIVNVNPWSIAGGSGAMYFVGSFDGKTFTPDRVAPANADPAQYQWLDHGADYYAAGTFANAPGDRPVAIAWMSNWDYADRIPTTPWKGAMTLPRELALKTIDGRPRLTFAPARSFDAFARNRPAVRVGSLAVASSTRELGADARGTVQRIALTIEPRSARRAGVVVRRSADGRTGTRIVYDTVARTLSVDRSASGEINFSNAFSKQHIVALSLVNGKLRLDVIVDRGSIEVFDGDGRSVVTDLVFPSPADDRIAVFAEDGDATFSDVVVTNLDAKALAPGTCAKY